MRFARFAALTFMKAGPVGRARGGLLDLAQAASAEPEDEAEEEPPGPVPEEGWETVPTKEARKAAWIRANQIGHQI